MNKLSTFFRNRPYIYWIFVALVFLILSLLQYYGSIRGHYIVPPGDDPYNHLNYINSIVENKTGFFDILKSGGYPPLFHFIIAKMSGLTHLDPLRMLVLIYPLIFILASIIIFIFSYLIFNRKVALIALLLYGFTQNAHLQLQNDGGYPNLIATGIFLPLLLLFVVYFFKKEKIAHKIIFLFLSIIFVILIFATHHLTTLYLIVLFLISLLVMIIYLWASNKWSYKKGLSFLLLYSGIVYSLFYSFQTSDVFASARKLSNMMIHLTNQYPFFETTAREKITTMPLDLYGDNLIKAIFIFGLIGLPYSFYLYKKSQKNYYPALLLLSVWVIVFFSISRMGFLSDPGRAMRDMTIPLVIFTAIFLSDILNRFKDKIVAIALLTICAYFWLWPNISQRFVSARLYEPMVRITDADIDAIKTIKNTPEKNKRILTNVSHPWLNYYLSDYNINYTQDYLRDADLLNYDFVYQIDNQMGWSSAPINYKFTKDISNGKLRMLGQYSTPTNNISVYQIIK